MDGAVHGGGQDQINLVSVDGERHQYSLQLWPNYKIAFFQQKCVTSSFFALYYYNYIIYAFKDTFQSVLLSRKYSHDTQKR